MGRYLNPEEKNRILAEFEERRNQPLPTGNLSGKGYPDPEILPFCDWLNSIDGVCTLQSCEGHAASYGYNVPSRGVLWIWFDRKLTELFRLRAQELARPPIERVSQVFSESQEFTEIIFNGNENGQLQKSLAILRSFMDSLVSERGSCHD